VGLPDSGVQVRTFAAACPKEALADNIPEVPTNLRRKE